MTYRMTIIHRVADIERWQAIVRRDDHLHRAGLLRRRAYRSLDDGNEVMVELDFESSEAAMSFLPSLDLRGLLDEMGLEVYPPVFIGEAIEGLSNDFSVLPE
jgi:hypothetical protein